MAIIGPFGDMALAVAVGVGSIVALYWIMFPHRRKKEE